MELWSRGPLHEFAIVLKRRAAELELLLHVAAGWRVGITDQEVPAGVVVCVGSDADEHVAPGDVIALEGAGRPATPPDGEN